MNLEPKQNRFSALMGLWKESTFPPVLAIGFLVGAILLFKWLTNTSTTEDMNTLVVYLIRSCGIVLVGMFVGMWKPHMHGEVDYNTAPLSKCLLDASLTCLYFFGLVFALFWH